MYHFDWIRRHAERTPDKLALVDAHSGRRLSGDDNPIHVDPTFASRTRFGRTVAHGMLLYSVVEAALSRWTPDLAPISQALKFPNPTYAAEQVRIRLEVSALEAASGVTTVRTTIVRPDGAIGLEGEAVLGPPNYCMMADPGGANEPMPELAAQPKAESSAPRAELRRSFDLAELAEYADLASGSSPVAGLPAATVPGGLLGGLFSCLLGTRLPGPGANYLKQRLEFHRPAHPQQGLIASVAVIRVRAEKHLVNLSTLCTNLAGEVVCSGEALVLASDVVKAMQPSSSQFLAADDSRPNPIFTEEKRS